MSAPLLYRSNERYRLCAAIAASISLHLVAIKAAETHQRAIVAPPAGPPEVYVDDAPAVPEPPAENLPPLPPPPPAPPIEEVEPEREPPRPPVQHKRPTIPIPHTSTGPRVAAISSAKAAAVVAPRPEYPYEARRQRVTGSGVAVLSVDSSSGTVTGVTMTQSTGSTVLDGAAVSAFRRWRFKPGTAATVRAPITFTMTGVQY